MANAFWEWDQKQVSKYVLLVADYFLRCGSHPICSFQFIHSTQFGSQTKNRQFLRNLLAKFRWNFSISVLTILQNYSYQKGISFKAHASKKLFGFASVNSQYYRNMLECPTSNWHFFSIALFKIAYRNPLPASLSRQCIKFLNNWQMIWDGIDDFVHHLMKDTHSNHWKCSTRRRYNGIW